MTETIVEFFRSFISNDYITIIVIAMLPIIELRGAVPIAISMGMNPFMTLFVAYIGSSIVVPFLLLMLRPILNVMKKIKLINNLAQAIEDLFRAKADKVLKNAEAKGKTINGEVSTKYKLIGVLTFVAIPLPLTGVWTGSAMAAFLDIKFLPALVIILIGNLIAGIIMTILSVFFNAYLDIIITAFLSLVVLILVFYLVTLLIKTRNNAEEQ